MEDATPLHSVTTISTLDHQSTIDHVTQNLNALLFTSVMTNYYTSVSTAKPLDSTVSGRIHFSGAPITVAISARSFLRYIVGLGLLKAFSLLGTCFGDSGFAAQLVVRGGLLT